MWTANSGRSWVSLVDVRPRSKVLWSPRFHFIFARTIRREILNWLMISWRLDIFPNEIIFAVCEYIAGYKYIVMHDILDSEKIIAAQKVAAVAKKAAAVAKKAAKKAAEMRAVINYKKAFKDRTRRIKWNNKKAIIRHQNRPFRRQHHRQHHRQHSQRRSRKH